MTGHGQRQEAGVPLDEPMARRLAQTTAFGVKEILAALATLRSFSGVTRANFEQVTKAAFDLAATNGTDLGTSVAVIGEALNEMTAGDTDGDRHIDDAGGSP